MLITVLLLLATAITANALDARIIGGCSTTIDKFPYQLCLQISFGRSCGASLIAPNKVLTLFDCVSIPLFMTVRGGSTTCQWGGFTRTITDVCSDSQMNVAVLTLNEPFDQSSKIQVIPLIEPNTNFTSNTFANATGWGYHNLFGTTTNLQVAELPMIHINECSKLVEITDEQICFGSKENGACMKDSGGPLVVEGKQVGIISASGVCTVQSRPSVHISLANERVNAFVNGCLKS